MDFFGKKKNAESVMLIDIAADSVAGAYARYEESLPAGRQGKTPALLYTRRLPIENRTNESRVRAMLRTLLVLGNELIREGAPILMRATGSGTANTILVSVDTPWQETKVRMENFERKDPFVFTKSMVDTMLKETSVVPTEKFLADESIIGSILNGYETHDPYGKKVRRASLVILTSLIDKNIFDTIVSALRSLFHTKNILPIAGNSLRYQAMHSVFPHERGALIIDMTGSLISIALIRKGLFVALTEMPQADENHSWIDIATSELSKLSKQYPLPRIIFLLARESEISSFIQILNTASFGILWLSDSPPRIVPVLASHIVGLVQQATSAPPDLQLLLMALFYQHRDFDER